METKDMEERISSRIADLAAAQKRLKRASILPLVERRGLAAVVAEEQAKLEALRSALLAGPGEAEEREEAEKDEASPAPDAATALAAAEAVLVRVTAAEHPPGRRSTARTGWRPGERNTW